MSTQHPPSGVARRLLLNTAIPTIQDNTTVLNLTALNSTATWNSTTEWNSTAVWNNATAFNISAFAIEEGQGVALKVAFGVVVLWTIISSLLVCSVNLRHRDMLKNPYNVSIFHLAVADLLSAVMTGITPGFISDDILFEPEGLLGSEVYCRLVTSHFFVFTFSSASIYIILALAIERWYAVVRPLQYRTTFHRRRLLIEIAAIWSVSVIANILLLFELHFHRDEPPGQRCQITNKDFTSRPLRKLIGFNLFLFKFLIPLSVTCILYINIFRETGRSRGLSRGREGVEARHSLSRMGAASTLALAIFWFPNQFYYAMYNFGAWELNNRHHYWTIVIAMLNSCFNPFIFAFHSVQYREGFKQLLLCKVTKVTDELQTTELNTRYHIMKASQVCCNAAGLKPPRSPIVIRKNCVGKINRYKERRWP